MGTGAVGGNVDGGMDDVPEVKTGGTGDGAFGGTGGDDFVAAISGDGDEEDVASACFVANAAAGGGDGAFVDSTGFVVATAAATAGVGEDDAAAGCTGEGAAAS